MEQFIPNFLNWLAEHWLGVGMVLSWVIQISPIKVNPWSAALKFIGSAINADLKKELADTKAQLKICITTIDENEKDRIRHEMFDFANSCRRGIHHTKGEFDYIIVQKGKYDDLLKKTNDTNGVFEEEYEFILEIYHTCQRENKFA